MDETINQNPKTNQPKKPTLFSLIYRNIPTYATLPDLLHWKKNTVNFESQMSKFFKMPTVTPASKTTQEDVTRDQELHLQGHFRSF